MDHATLSTTVWRTVESFLWLFGLAAGVWLIGFHLTVGIFLVVFIRLYGGGWRITLLITGLAEVFVITVFDMLLQVFWPTPVLFELFGLESWI